MSAGEAMKKALRCWKWLFIYPPEREREVAKAVKWLCKLAEKRKEFRSSSEYHGFKGAVNSHLLKILPSDVKVYMYTSWRHKKVEVIDIEKAQELTKSPFAKPVEPHDPLPVLMISREDETLPHVERWLWRSGGGPVRGRRYTCLMVKHNGDYYVACIENKIAESLFGDDKEKAIDAAFELLKMAVDNTTAKILRKVFKEAGLDVLVDLIS